MIDKIPGDCRFCGTALDRDAMQRFASACERLGEDLLVLGRDGIPCTSCFARDLTDQAEEDPSGPAARLIRMLRAHELGIRSVRSPR